MGYYSQAVILCNDKGLNIVKKYLKNYIKSDFIYDEISVENFKLDVNKVFGKNDAENKIEDCYMITFGTLEDLNFRETSDIGDLFYDLNKLVYDEKYLPDDHKDIAIMYMHIGEDLIDIDSDSTPYAWNLFMGAEIRRTIDLGTVNNYERSKIDNNILR